MTTPHDPNAGAYLLDSIRLAMGNIRERKTWPVGAVIARDGKVIATAVNEVDALCDPSAHAEMQAVRAAAKALNTTDLSGSTNRWCPRTRSSRPSPFTSTTFQRPEILYSLGVGLCGTSDAKATGAASAT